MELVLVGLRHGCQGVQVRQQLDAVVGLDVVHAVAEHLQQRVEDAPRVGLKHVGQQLTWEGHGRDEEVQTGERRWKNPFRI